MPWNANDASSSRVQQQNQQQAQHFHKQNQQRAAQQMSDLQARLRGSARPDQNYPYQEIFPDDQAFDGVTKRRGRKMGFAVLILVLATICGAVIAVSSIVVAGQDRGVKGTVRPGDPWNLRAGPSTKSDILGQVQPGDKVTVVCLNGNWARLTAPKQGAFVYIAGVTLETVPPPC